MTTKVASNLASVVIPTLRRPRLLTKAVASALAQDLAAGWEMEVVIAVSDPSSEDDVRAARALAADPRVRVALAPARGAGAARNAGVLAARGQAIAFIDDDCEAQPGWLREGLLALGEADLVQGRTAPATKLVGWDHSIRVDPPSWLWESCNLFCTREAFLRTDGFNPAWNAAGRMGHQYGEDVEWGWAMVRQGARPGFAPGALVHHVVEARSFRGYLAYIARLRVFPRLIRTTPEVRRIFYRGYFVDQRHVALTGVAGLVVGSGTAGVAGARKLSLALLLAALVGYLWPYRRPLLRGRLRTVYGELRYRGPREATEFGAVVYGSIRWRRLLL